MTDWRNVIGSQETQPEEWDTTSSPTTVYQRRDVQPYHEETEDGEINGWQYQERTYTRAEYDALTGPATQAIMQGINEQTADVLTGVMTDTTVTDALTSAVAEIMQAENDNLATIVESIMTITGG